MPTPSSATPARRPTSMVTTASVIGMPSRRASTWLQQRVARIAVVALVAGERLLDEQPVHQPVQRVRRRRPAGPARPASGPGPGSGRRPRPAPARPGPAADRAGRPAPRTAPPRPCRPSSSAPRIRRNARAQGPLVRRSQLSRTTVPSSVQTSITSHSSEASQRPRPRGAVQAVGDAMPGNGSVEPAARRRPRRAAPAAVGPQPQPAGARAVLDAVGGQLVHREHRVGDPVRVEARRGPATAAVSRRSSPRSRRPELQLGRGRAELRAGRRRVLAQHVERRRGSAGWARRRRRCSAPGASARTRSHPAVASRKGHSTVNGSPAPATSRPRHSRIQYSGPAAGQVEQLLADDQRPGAGHGRRRHPRGPAHRGGEPGHGVHRGRVQELAPRRPPAPSACAQPPPDLVRPAPP